MPSLPVTESDIDAFLRAFEDGTLPKQEWTHAAHLLGGACYVYTLGAKAALEHMRACVQRYNEAVGGRNTETSGYHETLTVFWIATLRDLRRALQPASRSQFAHAAVEAYGQRRDLFKDFYSFDVVASTRARREWVAPDLRSLAEFS